MDQSPPNIPKLWSISEVASYLAVPKSWIYAHTQSNAARVNEFETPRSII